MSNIYKAEQTALRRLLKAVLNYNGDDEGEEEAKEASVATILNYPLGQASITKTESKPSDS